MKILLENLINTLEKIIAYHNKLYALLKREKETMMKYSVSELETCTKEKETITLKLKILEESRIRIIKNLSIHLNINEKDLTASRLSRICDGRYSKIFKEISSRLNTLIVDISRLNNENRIFIEYFMNHIKVSLSFLTQVNLQELTYINNGEIKDNSVNSRTLCKV